MPKPLAKFTRPQLAAFAKDPRTLREMERLRDTALSGYDGKIPVGGIILWSGAVSTVPDGWALCDGDNGTPDLRDRFVIGAGSRNPGDTGGAESVTSSAVADHAHGVGTLANDAVTDHSHTAGTFAADAVAGHSHTFTTSTASGTQAIGTGTASATGAHSHSGTTDPAGGHGHTISGNSAAAGGHSHAISGSTANGGGHSHDVATMPPWYALAFIMRIA